ncbi:hypothetical protein SEA_SATIS_155 [Streptomyces phage Satis]|nr:hypothetical protein SEA_SATIS_155 [Streptomyces phage Satis]
MVLPPQRTVTGTYVNPVTGKPYDGTNARGHYLIFEPYPPIWTDREGNQILLGSGRTNLDENGSFEKDLVCTSGIDVLPTSRLWRIIQNVGDESIDRYFSIPEGDGPLDISDLLSVDIAGVTYVPVPGPPGPQGPPGEDGDGGGGGGADGKSAYEVAVEEGFTGTVDEWLASLVGEPGPQGIQGVPGADGEDGAQGETGPQPPLGDAGDGPTVALKSDDPTTTDARTPLAHASTHASAGSDPVTPDAIGAYRAEYGNNLNSFITDLQERVGGEFGLENRMTAAETSVTTRLAKAANLTDLVSPSTARTSLGLGGAAVLNVGTAAGSVAAGNDSRITGALQSTGGTINGNLAVTGHALGQDTPAAHGITAWCYDPAVAVNATQVSNGVLYLVRLNIPAAVNLTKIYWWVGNQGSGPTAGQNEVGLYSSAGALLAATNVDSAISSAGLKTTTIASQALAAGSFCWVGMVFNASGTPTLTRSSGWTGVEVAANLGLGASAYRFAINGSGRTALPGSITPGSNTGTDFAGPWAAVGP